MAMKRKMLISHNGQSMTRNEWAKRLGVTPGALAQRLHRGMSLDQVVSRPRRGHQNLVGKTFGFLTVIKRGRNVWSSGQSKGVWVCRCKCGTISRVWTQSLVQGNTKSCGCHGKGRERKNNRSKEHTSWRAMMQRCYNPKDKHYQEYGGRGIEVYRLWHIFDEFLFDMGRAPTLRHTLDRFPNQDGNYTPGNVRWATPKQQAANKRIR